DAGSPDPGVFRHQLLGPAARALEVLEPLRGEGIDNLGVAVGVGRLRLNGEGPDVVPLLAPFLHWAYVSNCVPTLGAVAPRFRAEGGVVGALELAAFMRALAEINYTGPLGVAVRPAG